MENKTIVSLQNIMEMENWGFGKFVLGLNGDKQRAEKTRNI